jgi:hypothetical protein
MEKGKVAALLKSLSKIGLFFTLISFPIDCTRHLNGARFSNLFRVKEASERWAGLADSSRSCNESPVVVYREKLALKSGNRRGFHFRFRRRHCYFFRQVKSPLFVGSRSLSTLLDLVPPG